MISRHVRPVFFIINVFFWGGASSVFAQTTRADLPIAMTVTNPECTINNGKGLPDKTLLPVVTTDGNFSDNNSVDVPIIIYCAGEVSKFDITFTGGSSSKIPTSNADIDISLVWKKGGGAITFNSPTAINKAPYLINKHQFDASLTASVTPRAGVISAGVYTASLPVTFTYY